VTPLPNQSVANSSVLPVARALLRAVSALVPTLCFAAPLLLTSCGNVGEPMYPSLNIPARITDLRVIERGSALVANFTIPSLTTDGVAVKNLRSAELAVGEKQVPVDNTEPGPVVTQFPVDGLAGKELPVRVRLINARGRASEWSNVVTLTVVAPLTAPSELKPDLVQEGVKLTWSAPGETHFRIFRRAEKEVVATQVAESDGLEYVDTKTEHNKNYEYTVQGVSGTAESEISPAASILTKDIFPPAVPAGLTASPGIDTVELAWDRNTETDFRGYRVYRSVDGGPLDLIADMIAAPSFSDKNIQPGKRYRYAVSAVNQVGTESKQSTPVEITI
jgi:predicted phage tail protein